MKKLVALVLALVLICCLSFSAFADGIVSPGGGDDPNPPSPPTGSIAVAVLAATACLSGGVFVVSKKKADEE